MGGKVLELTSDKLLNIGKFEGEILLGSLITELFADGRPSDAELTLLGSLISILIKAERNSDVKLAAENEEARKKLDKEFGMID